MTEIITEAITRLKDLLASVGPAPWFLSDCEGDLQIWRESALQRVSRACSGEIVGYSTPSSYKRNDLVASWDLDTWDEGEDEDDDERRRMAELIVEAVNALPHLIAAAEAAQADQAEPLIDPDCRDGKCGSCVGGPCTHDCHQAGSEAGQ